MGGRGAGGQGDLFLGEAQGDAGFAAEGGQVADDEFEVGGVGGDCVDGGADVGEVGVEAFEEAAFVILDEVDGVAAVAEGAALAVGEVAGDEGAGVDGAVFDFEADADEPAGGGEGINELVVAFEFGAEVFGGEDFPADFAHDYVLVELIGWGRVVLGGGGAVAAEDGGEEAKEDAEATGDEGEDAGDDDDPPGFTHFPFSFQILNFR